MLARWSGVDRAGPRADQWRPPSIDHLSDRDFIGFEDNGRLIVSPVARRPSLHRMGIDTEKTINVGSFTSRQKQFLDFHRNAVLCKPIAAEKD